MQSVRPFIIEYSKLALNQAAAILFDEYDTFSCTYRKQKPSWNAVIKINKPESKTSKVGDV